VLLRVVNTLADGVRHFTGLAQSRADAALAVTNDDERAEREAAATLDHLRDAVEGDDLFGGTRCRDRHRARDGPCAYPSQNFNPASRAASARALTRPWIEIAGTVEHHGVDTCRRRGRGSEISLADGRRSGSGARAGVTDAPTRSSAPVVDAETSVSPGRVVDQAGRRCGGGCGIRETWTRRPCRSRACARGRWRRVARGALDRAS
jgi:hypothetical protein